jgi:hypothetical protein
VSVPYEPNVFGGSHDMHPGRRDQLSLGVNSCALSWSFEASAIAVFPKITVDLCFFSVFQARITLLHAPGTMIAAKMLTTMHARHETHPYSIGFFTYIAILLSIRFRHLSPSL